MKKFIYILLFALATTISISAHTEKAVVQSSNNDGPIGGLVSDPKWDPSYLYYSQSID